MRGKRTVWLARMGMALGVLAAVLVVVVLGAASWLVRELRAHLEPPPDPPGQPSIASYERPDPSPPLPAPAWVTGFDWNTILEPPRSARPWTRWWWPGGDVDERTLVDQLEELDAAGFGGAEIQPFISGVMAVEDPAVWERVYRFDSPSYHATVARLLRAAEARGWQIDLTHGSGWPPGGPQVDLDDSPTVLVYSEARVTGGRRLELELPRPHAGPSEYFLSAVEFAGADFINFPAGRARLLSVLAARPLGGARATSPFALDDTLALDADTVTLLTAQVENGVLRWDAPPGEWHVVASWTMPSGEVPIGAAQQPQGFAIDPLRVPQVRGHYEYAFGERTGLPAHYGRGLRGIFNDSLEFRLTRMSAADILLEFAARRGYDLEPWLPAIFVEGIDNVYFREIMDVHPAPEFALTPLDARIRHDYQKTLSDLAIERFVETSAAWAESRGLASRAQSYGMDMDLIRALGANTIPETEQLWAGGSDLGLKMASSAAALHGRPLVSAESFVWVGRDWSSTARRLKAAADKAFLAGINHIVHHGTPYPWRGSEPSPFGDEGWAPFSGPENPGHFSSVVGAGNTALWPDVPDLNRYLARCQNLLRQGAPAIDVLIYYPFLGFHGANPGGGTEEPLLNGFLPDADPRQNVVELPILNRGKRLLGLVLGVPPAREDPRDAWVGALLPLVGELDRRGIRWGWVNDHALQSGRLGARTLEAGGSYQLLLLPNAPMIEQQTLRALAGLAAEGVPVILSGELPARQPGFRDAEQGDREVRELVRELLGSGARHLELDVAALVDAVQARIHLLVGQHEAGPIRNLRRQLGAGRDIHLFANQSVDTASLALDVAPGQPLWWFDASSGAAWPAQSADGRVSLVLRGFESRFLVRGVPFPATLRARVAASAALESAGRRWSLAEWELSLDGAPSGAAELRDWRQVPALRHARGPGVYRSRIALDAVKPDARYVLDLGLVHGSARVTVNGREIGRASLPPFLIDVGSALRSGENRIEVEVTAPLRNYFVGRARGGDPRYAHMGDYRDQLVAAGLVGPVALAELP